MLPIALLGLLLFAEPPQSDLEAQLKKFIDVYARVEQEAADPVEADRAFWEGAIPGMLRRLDPHSVFFDPGQYEQLQQMEKSERKGFGTVVSVLPGRVIVLQALPGTPSARAGLSPGDEILAVNGIELSRLQFEQLVQLLGEARQHEARLVVRKPGNVRLFDFRLTPELMDAPSVDREFMLAPGIGYLRITSFDAGTGRLVKDTIEKLGGTKLKGLVLDLRDNTGGVAQAAVDVASLFLKPAQPVLSIRGRATQSEEVKVQPKADPYSFPLAVLVNGKTASASEIVAGALQDHDRAVIIGEPTFGKGLVQSVYTLSSNTGLALTTAFYYTPSGRSIQHPLEGVQLDTARLASQKVFHTDSGRVVTGGGGIQPDEVVYPEPATQLSAVLDASGAYTRFAADYLQTHTVSENFEVTGALLDEFQVFLSARNIRPGVSDWLRDREEIQSRLKQEIFNLAFGVAKGDEVEAQHDPVVQRAVKDLRRSRP